MAITKHKCYYTRFYLFITRVCPVCCPICARMYANACANRRKSEPGQINIVSLVPFVSMCQPGCSPSFVRNEPTVKRENSRRRMENLPHMHAYVCFVFPFSRHSCCRYFHLYRDILHSMAALASLVRFIPYCEFQCSPIFRAYSLS